MNPVLTLLVASSIQMASERPQAADLAALVYEITQAVAPGPGRAPEAAAPTTVCQVPHYYDLFLPLSAPASDPIVTYDWRSPVILDLP